MEQNTPLQLELNQLLQQLNLSIRTIARMIPTSETTLRQYLANEYKGKIAELEEKIKSFIQREKEKRTSVNLEMPLVETKVMRVIIRGMRKCHLKNVAGCFYGDSGIGKTTAAQEYAKRYKDTIYIEANRAYSAKILFKHLHLLLGYNGHGATITMMTDVIARLKDSGRFIIIDQAEYLNETTLHLLRTVKDKARIGIALLGTDDLYFLIKGKRGEMKQVFTRLPITANLEKLNDDDIVNLVHAALPKQKDIAQEFVKYANGNAMKLWNLLFNVLEFPDANKITPKHIQEANKLIFQ